MSYNRICWFLLQLFPASNWHIQIRSAVISCAGIFDQWIVKLQFYFVCCWVEWWRQTPGSGGLVSVSGSCLITVVMSEGTSATIVQLFTGQAPGWSQSQNIENKFFFLIMLYIHWPTVKMRLLKNCFWKINWVKSWIFTSRHFYLSSGPFIWDKLCEMVSGGGWDSGEEDCCSSVTMWTLVSSLPH